MVSLVTLTTIISLNMTDSMIDMFFLVTVVRLVSYVTMYALNTIVTELTHADMQTDGQTVLNFLQKYHIIY